MFSVTFMQSSHIISIFMRITHMNEYMKFKKLQEDGILVSEKLIRCVMVVESLDALNLA